MDGVIGPNKGILRALPRGFQYDIVQARDDAALDNTSLTWDQLGTLETFQSGNPLAGFVFVAEFDALSFTTAYWL
jgi:hypothetical protein